MINVFFICFIFCWSYNTNIIRTIINSLDEFKLDKLNKDNNVNNIYLYQMPPKKKVYVSPISTHSCQSFGGFLVIVESPSKITKIKSYLGSGYDVIASKGHICTIANIKDIDVKNGFKVKYTEIPSKKSHITTMKDTISKYLPENVIIATDNDREGESIGYHICSLFGLPVETTKRIIFNEITESAIKTAVQNPIVLDLGIIRSAMARQILDIVIGFKISPVLWKHVYHSKSNALSAGRCQTPALGIIYENYKQGLCNESKKLYKTMGSFFQHNISFELSREFETYNEIKQFLNESVRYKHTLLGTGDKKLSVKTAPRPLNTSRMLQLSGGSPKYTMQLAQKLYQEGHITYMRTESTKYSKDFLEKAEKYIIHKFGSIGGGGDNKKWVGDLSKITNTSVALPHEAIRVTNLNIQSINSGDKKLDSLYRLIWKITIESCMANAIYDTYNITISAPQGCIYINVLEIPVFLGWKQVDKNESMDDSSNSAVLFYIQSLGKDVDVLYNYINSTTVVRGKHIHYNETSLIQKLEDLGIGRPSTYAMFVETIQERGYVTKKDVIGKKIQCIDFILRKGECLEENTLEKIFGEEKTKLVIEPLGILCIDFLLTHFSELFDYSYTKNMEDKLDKISEEVLGVNDNWYDICAVTLEDIETMIKLISKMTKQTYRIDDSHELVFQQYGPCVRHIIPQELPHTSNLIIVPELLPTTTKKASKPPKEPKPPKPIIEYLPVKKTIELDLERLKRGEYILEDLVEYKTSYLGEYEGNQLHIHVGQYGPYIEWGLDKERKSIKNIQKPIDEFTIDDAINCITQEEVCEDSSIVGKGIIRVLDANTSIRRGRFGIYVYYNPPEEKKPHFICIKKFSENYMTCDPQNVISWVKEQSIIPKKSVPKRFTKK